MPLPDQSQTEDGNAPSQARPARDKSVTAPRITSSDSIAEFLDHLTKQHESGAVFFPGTNAPFENKSSLRT